MGLGILVEYESKTGNPVWKDPSDSTTWDYSQFANVTRAKEPGTPYELTFTDMGPQEGSHFDTWTINGKSLPNVPYAGTH